MDNNINKKALTDSQQYIIGFDEVGRGALAGPVVACAFLALKPLDLPLGRDSKKLSAKQREFYFTKLSQEHIFGLGFVDHLTIDKINIREASFLAMQRALDQLVKKLVTTTKNNSLLVNMANLINIPNQEKQRFIALIDGRDNPQLNLNHQEIPFQCIIKGDEKIAQIQASSIIAKVSRDKYMQDLHSRFPLYDFAANKGYGVKKHLQAILYSGACPQHRKSFKPMKDLKT